MNNMNSSNKKFELNDLDVNEINTIISGLMELPGKISMGLYTKIRQQIESQIQMNMSDNSDAQKMNNVNGPLADKVIQ